MKKLLTGVVFGLATVLGGACAATTANEGSPSADTAQGSEEELCPGGFVSGGVDTHGRECAAMAGACCYESPDDACDAADCAGECRVADSVPAQISCQ